MQIIGDVLDACGDNIDSAIKQLGQLRLTAHCGTAQPSASGADQAANPSAAAGSQAAGEQSIQVLHSRRMQPLLLSEEECNPCCHFKKNASLVATFGRQLTRDHGSEAPIPTP